MSRFDRPFIDEVLTRASILDVVGRKHGNALDFIIATENVPFPEAVERLARDLGIPLPARDPEAITKDDQAKRLTNALDAARAAFAQTWPDRPIRIVVPFPAGAGVLDIMARLLAQHLGPALGQQIVIDNRPGAGGTIGADVVAKAPPDGYTVLMGNPSLVVN
eukprot:gene34852-biopygen25329